MESSLMLGVSRGRILLKMPIFVGTSLSPMTSRISDCWRLVFWTVCLLLGATRFIPINYSYRLTASLIEIFLHSDNVPRHRVLTLFAEHLTGFKITNAIELEAGEPPIFPDLVDKIKSYQPLTELRRLFEVEGLLES